MNTIEEFVEVDVPVTTAYNQWTQFETFPQFMHGVREVRQLDDSRLHWVAEIAGQTREWDARITEQVPDKRIAWTSESGMKNDGVVTFESVGSDKTVVHLQLDHDAEGIVENVGEWLGLAKRQAKKDLDRFKEMIESEGAPTGAWRGEIRDDRPGGPTQ